MRLLERGYKVLKFFPAESSGGSQAIKSLAGPLPDVKFCPTGGVTPENVGSYLELTNVLCVGGSWIAPMDLVIARDWQEIEERAKAASSQLANAP